MDADWIIRSRRVVLPGGMREAAIRIRHGVVQELCPYHVRCNEDVGDLVIMPGLVDTHVHINEPGRTRWEGFATATQAAAAGGITTLIEMPLNSSPATTSRQALREKMSMAADQCAVDVGFWGGVVPDNAKELEVMLHEGCFGFKCFLVPSGIDDFDYLRESDLRKSMTQLAGLGAVLLIHAELPELLLPPAGDPRDYANYLSSRPDAAEVRAIELLLGLCRETGCRIHVVHVSSRLSLAAIREARARELPVSAETCPHYLVFSAEDIPAGATEFKCAPPVRERSHRAALWKALQGGVLSMVASDHSPCLPEMKQKEKGDFFTAWGGISSLQLALPVVWTEARRRGFGAEDIARWMAAAPARLAGLEHRKGAVAPGHDADFFVWDPDEEFVVHAEDLRHRHKLTPYLHHRLCGVVKSTYLRGLPVCAGGRPQGRILKREGSLNCAHRRPGPDRVDGREPTMPPREPDFVSGPA